MHITKRLFLAAAMAAGFVGSVQAADLDLNGVDRTVTDVAELASYDGVTNTSDTLATLTFDISSDMEYGGTISGNIKVAKKGVGMLTLSGSNTYTGGTEVGEYDGSAYTVGGRLRANSVTAFGATTGAITVNSDCQQSSMNSNKVTCVVFNAAGEFAYPINTSAWTTPANGPSGDAGTRQYNVAVQGNGAKTTLSGKIAGGGLSVHFGGLNWDVKADQPSSGSTLEISGEIDCQNGTCHFGSRGRAINVTGKVTALGIYQTTTGNWPPTWSLSNTDNDIDIIDVGGGASSDYSLTASAANALGGAMVYSRYASTKSYSVRISDDQAVESFSMNPSGTYTPADLSSSDGRHYVNATAAATVTMNGTADRVCDWCLKDGGATAAMSLVWAPTGDYTLTCAGHANTIHGTIAVSRGTFATDEFCSFPNVTSIALGAGTTLSVATNDTFSATVAIEAESGATLDMAADMTASTVKVGDHYLSAKDFSAGTYKGLTITGAGTLYVTTRPGGEDTYTWTGGGADDNLTTAANWQDGQMPDFDDESPFVVFASGAAAVVNTNATFSGATFACAGDFALSASGDCVLALGEGGISNAPAASARAITVSASVMPLVDQVWQMETNTTFTLSGILKQYGTSTPTLTFRQSSIADPVITFIGAATAEGAGDFAGDIVFEETALPDGKYGTAHVRAVGFEPFGPDGTLNVKSQGAGHNVLARRARLTLANAVVSKAVEYGDYYRMDVYAEDNTTNVMNGAFTPFKAHASSGTFPPDFHVGTNAVLRLVGEMDFGTRVSANDNSIVSLDSTAENVADSPTGTIAFDGRITRLARSLELGSPIRLEFNAADNAVTNLNLRHAQNATAVVSFGTDYALSNGQAKVTFPNYQSTAVDFDLNGTTQHIAGFAARTSGNAPTTSRISSSGAPGVLRVSQASDVVFEGYVATNATIQMEGDATLTFTHATAFRAGSALVVSNGTVAVSSATALNRNVNLSLLGGAISIPSGQTAVVGSASYLDANGAVKALPVGVYGPGDASVGAYFAAGSGSIRVTDGRDPCTVISFR